MRNNFLVLLILLCSTTLFANNIFGANDEKKSDVHITGHVLDSETKEHVSYISVSIKGTMISTTTDATGHYFLRNIPEGRHQLIVSGLGYKKEEREVDIVKGKSLEVNFVVKEDRIQLETVVVSANRNEINRREAPSVVNVLGSKILENTGSVCLAQGLNFQPGLRVESNCQNCGFQQVRINGLEGAYSQILIDSRPIFSSLAGVYGIEQIPSNMIDRVEVVRGGGSALYGSNAIAGTINIITKEPISNSLTLSNTTTFIHQKSPDIYTTLNASLVSDDFSRGVVLFGSIRQRVPMDYDKDGFSEIGKQNLKNIGFRAYQKLGSQFKITAEYHNMYEFRRGGDLFERPPHEANIAEQTDHNIDAGGLKLDYLSKDLIHRLSIYSSFQEISRKSYYGAEQNIDAYGITNDKTFVSGVQYTLNPGVFLFMPYNMTFGGEYLINSLEDKMLGYNRIIDQTAITKSLFMQNEWKTSSFSFLAGLRMDSHNMVDHIIWSPRLSVRANPFQNLTLRAGFSTGFRAPQTFDEDLHVTAVGGNVKLIKVDPNLKIERSQSFTCSAESFINTGKIQGNFLAELFYTNLKDVFVLDPIEEDDQGNIVLERTNAAGAVVKGVNLEGKLVPSQKLSVQFGFTIQSSKYKELYSWSKNPSLLPQRKMFRSPDRYGYITLSYDFTKRFIASLSGTYTGPMLVQHNAGYIENDSETLTQDFYDVNLKLSYDFSLSAGTVINLSAGVKNIFNSYQDDFDKGVLRDAGYIYGPSLPRSLFFGVKLSI